MVICFADDIICLAKTKMGTERQLEIIVDWCKKWKMKVSDSKTFATTLSEENKWQCKGQTDDEDYIFLDTPDISYLGLEYQIKGRDFLGQQYWKMELKADKYVYAILNTARDSLDQSLIARRVCLNTTNNR